MTDVEREKERLRLIDQVEALGREASDARTFRWAILAAVVCFFALCATISGCMYADHLRRQRCLDLREKALASSQPLVAAVMPCAGTNAGSGR